MRDLQLLLEQPEPDAFDLSTFVHRDGVALTSASPGVGKLGDSEDLEQQSV